MSLGIRTAVPAVMYSGLHGRTRSLKLRTQEIKHAVSIALASASLQLVPAKGIFATPWVNNPKRFGGPYIGRYKGLG